jgi:hypothetical protein
MEGLRRVTLVMARDIAAEDQAGVAGRRALTRASIKQKRGAG